MLQSFSEVLLPNQAGLTTPLLKQAQDIKKPYRLKDEQALHIQVVIAAVVSLLTANLCNVITHDSQSDSSSVLLVKSSITTSIILIKLCYTPDSGQIFCHTFRGKFHNHHPCWNIQTVHSNNV